MLRADAFNLLNHPNFAVQATHKALLRSGQWRRHFQEWSRDFADNVGRIFSTVDAARQIQIGVRFVF